MFFSVQIELLSVITSFHQVSFNTYIPAGKWACCCQTMTDEVTTNMPDLLPYITNVTIIDEQIHNDKSVLDISYQNTNEPIKWSQYKLRIERLQASSDWNVLSICSFNPDTRQFEDIGRLYSAPLIKQLHHTVLEKLRRKANLQTRSII